MKFTLLISLVLLTGFLTACSSRLAQSKTDEKMRYQGSYSCQNVSLEKSSKKESVVEADVARIRCAKDEWKVEGEKIIFTRSLFQGKNCDTVLGRIEFTAPYQVVKEKLVVTQPSCKLVRVSNGWIGEGPKCMLNKLDLNTPYRVESVFACSNYVPKECQANIESVSLESVEPTDGLHLPFDKVIVRASGSKITSNCDRYAGE